MMVLEKLLSMREAADTLGVTKKTLLVHVRLGRLAYINLGTGSVRETRRFRPSDLVAFVQAQRQVCFRPVPDVFQRRRAGPSMRPPALLTGGVRALLALQAGQKAPK